jgi:hypothetical protein
MQAVIPLGQCPEGQSRLAISLVLVGAARVWSGGAGSR